MQYVWVRALIAIAQPPRYADAAVKGGMSERIKGLNSPTFNVSAVRRKISLPCIPALGVVGPVRVTRHNASIG
jgi:hypothetical protein